MLILVPKLDDVEAATVHVEMDVAFLEVRRDGLPDSDFGMHCFHGLPSRLADALAMAFWRHEQQLQIAFPGLLFDGQHDSTHFLAVHNNAIGLGVFSVDRVLDGTA